MRADMPIIFIVFILRCIYEIIANISNDGNDIYSELTGGNCKFIVFLFGKIYLTAEK